MDELTREIRFDPAWDRSSPDPQRNYGISGVSIWFFLKGPKGAIQFHLLTHWMLPHNQKDIDIKTAANCDLLQLRCFYHPLPADLGYHSPVPMYEGQRPHGSVRFEWRDPTEEEKKQGLDCLMPISIERDTYSQCDLVPGGMCF